MDDLEQKIQSVLADPAQMQQILGIARSLGVELPDAMSGQEPPAEENTAAAPPHSAPDGAFSEPVAQLLQQAGKLEKKQENLLNALKPFLKPNRREKIDRAMQVARLSHLAGYALRSRGENKP